jgi:predicted MPP superfamily phosphohydrolase
MSEPVIMSRRTFLKKSLGLLGAGMIAGTYPVFGERFWYLINEVRLSIDNLPAAFRGWKVVQFSDVHFGFHYGLREFGKVVNIINDLNPDVLLFTGDLVQRGNAHPERMIPLLQKLQARGGKWAVTGNHDYPTKTKVVNALQSSEFQVLENKHGIIPFNGQFLYIAGLDEVLYGNPNLAMALKGLSVDDCVLLLVHEPDVADSIAKYPVSAQFSGHSHGGQVRIPFYGPVFTPELAQKYVDGLYYVGERKMPLYVNRGVGTSSLPIRFSCRPEITVFHLS